MAKGRKRSIKGSKKSSLPEDLEQVESTDGTETSEDVSMEGAEDNDQSEDKVVAPLDEEKGVEDSSDQAMEVGGMDGSKGQDGNVEENNEVTENNVGENGGNNSSNKNEGNVENEGNNQIEGDGENVENEESDIKEAIIEGEFDVVDEIDSTKEEEEEEIKEPPKKKKKVKVKKPYMVLDYDSCDVIVEADSDSDSEGIVESDEFKKYWNQIVESPHDFTAWTYLLQLVEQEDKLPLARRAYNEFFKRYPLCYGYWKKFSELERKAGNLDRAQKILERGVRSISLSIDLWVHTVDFYINHYKGVDAGDEKIRSVFNRAIRVAGEEFRSEKLWNKYLNWEKQNKRWKSVLSIYTKALSTLTQNYSIFFNDLNKFVDEHSPKDILDEATFKEYLAVVRKQIAETKKNEDKTEASKSEGEDGEDFDAEMDEAPPGDEDHEKPTTNEELKAIQAYIVEVQKKLFHTTEQAVTKVWAYEEGIKRPYFHVKQLERAQLKNWREYLDSEIALRGDHHRTVLLFERCLIACALYEDFWLKYAKYMSKFDNEKTLEIYKRACQVHLPKKPNIHMQWAAHEELQGNSASAAKILESLDYVVPGMASIKMRRVAVERRAGNLDVAEGLLRCYVATAAKDKEEMFYTRKLAWFLLKIANKPDEAKELIKELIPKYRGDIRLYNDLIEMEFQMASASYPSTEQEEQSAMDTFNLALVAEKLTDDEKYTFSQKKLEFLEDFGCDVKRIQKVLAEHQKMARHKKRNQSEASNDASQTAKKPKTDNTSISVVGTSITNGTTSVAAATYTAPSTGYDATAAYYQQQQQYWNYQQQQQTPQQNYAQWQQYYPHR